LMSSDRRVLASWIPTLIMPYDKLSRKLSQSRPWNEYPKRSEWKVEKPRCSL
jgi:hypothetical protein